MLNSATLHRRRRTIEAFAVWQRRDSRDCSELRSVAVPTWVTKRTLYQQEQVQAPAQASRTTRKLQGH